MDQDEFCEECEGFNPGEFCDCEPIEEDDIDHGDPYEINDYATDQIGPDYWRNDAGEWRCG